MERSTLGRTMSLFRRFWKWFMQPFAPCPICKGKGREDCDCYRNWTIK